MELEHSFTVPVPRDEAWTVLLDVERVAPCMPGATLDSVDGDEIKGRIKVKLGPISMTYTGTARFTERDAVAGIVTLSASGKETRGSGTASATVRSELVDHGPETQVVVRTSLNVTGRPAQLGRGVMADVSSNLIGIFAGNLAAMLASGDTSAEAAPVNPDAATAPDERAPAPVPPVPSESRAAGVGGNGGTSGDSVNLLSVAGLPVLKRLLPLGAGLAAVSALLVWLRARRRSRH